MHNGQWSARLPIRVQKATILGKIPCPLPLKADMDHASRIAEVLLRQAQAAALTSMSPDECRSCGALINRHSVGYRANSFSRRLQQMMRFSSRAHWACAEPQPVGLARRDLLTDRILNVAAEKLSTAGERGVHDRERTGDRINHHIAWFRRCFDDSLL